MHRIETPVGPVEATLHDDGSVSVRNVLSYRLKKGVEIEVDSFRVCGDIAWGGNWFFLVNDHGLRVAADNIERLTDYAWRARQALEVAGIRGDGGSVIDHIELFASDTGADSRNFVLCPGKAYDRSPCGTGTSAKLACLAADGKLAPEQLWVQESIVGSRFQARYRLGENGRVIPRIRGRAYVVADAVNPPAARNEPDPTVTTRPRLRVRFLRWQHRNIDG